MRGESLFKAELSDMLNVNFQVQNKDPDRFDILVMALSSGKTLLAGHKLYGRAMRAKLVYMCPIGAFAIYLLVRFDLTNEFDDENRPDFTKNEDWYDIRLLIAFGTKNGCQTTKEGRSKERWDERTKEGLRKAQSWI